MRVTDKYPPISVLHFCILYPWFIIQRSKPNEILKSESSQSRRTFIQFHLGSSSSSFLFIYMLYPRERNKDREIDDFNLRGWCFGVAFLLLGGWFYVWILEFEWRDIYFVFLEFLVVFYLCELIPFLNLN